LINSLDADNVRAARPDIEIIAPESLGVDELLGDGLHYHEIGLELALRACRELGVARATVPPGFPLDVADHLRPAGVELVPDRDVFEARRRAKTDAELAGIRRAQRAAEAGMRAAAALIATAAGAEVTCEQVRAAIEAELTAHGAAADAIMVAPGAQGAVGHELGEGPIAPGDPVIVDLWPQDRASACFADMTRTFVAGEPDAEIVAWHALCLEALDRSVMAVRAGATGRDVWGAACDVFEAAGQPTQRTKTPGEQLRDGFFHSLGHGVGLEVHESPVLGRGPDVLAAGDVLAIEPGLYRRGYGGVRLEDLVVVTDDGAEMLTAFPYDLRPA
jgi:Xaa-Pro aminopeptidase